MTNGIGSTISGEKRAELFRDFIQTVLSLAAGSVVFSVTFLHDVLHIGDASAGQSPAIPKHSYYVLLAWVALLVAVIAALVYLYFHAISTKYERAYGWPLTIAAIVACFSLVAGLILLIVFGFFNLSV
ncbi:MAG: hypothetical protein WA734_13840 [Candidatus Acidiferrales bacterium]